MYNALGAMVAKKNTPATQTFTHTHTLEQFGEGVIYVIDIYIMFTCKSD